jgi:hypothetical protein
MSYLVLALGFFLSLCGAMAIVAGYGIIQVERGWATFIAGSTAFSCGIVTLALGLILGRLISLHALIKSEKGLTEKSLTEKGLAPPMRPMRSNLAAARNFLKSRTTVLPAARGSSEADYSSQKGPQISRETWKSAQTTVELPPEPDFVIPAEVTVAKAQDKQDKTETRPASVPAEEEPAEFVWHAENEPGLFDEDEAGTADKIERLPIEQPFPDSSYNPRTSEAQSRADVTWPAEPVSIDRIFEEEFLLSLNPSLVSRNEDAELAPETSEPASPSPEPPIVAEAITAAVPEPSSEPPEPASSTGQEELAIVGQYESAGTSYIMYSDGSIEARAAHAVFHFKSMAELKTFLESEAPTSQD